MTKPLWLMAEQSPLLKLLEFKETSRSSTYGPYGYVGRSRLDKPTHDAIVTAHYLAGKKCEFTQGGLNDGAVAESAKTHNGLGVGDTVARGFTEDEVLAVLAYGSECGVTGFARGINFDNISDGMVVHIHWVRNDSKGVAHPSAYAQIYDKNYGYKYGGAGLAGNPRARYWGPPRKPLIAWEDSRHNPKNW